MNTHTTYHVTHRTTYQYSEPVSISHHVLRLSPRATSRQHVIKAELQIEPAPVVLSQYTDRYSNTIHFLSIEGGHLELTINSISTVELFPAPTLTLEETTPWENVRDHCANHPLGDTLEAAEFTYESPLIQTRLDYLDYTTPSFPAECPILAATADLTHRIFQDFKFDPEATTVATPLQEVFSKRRGVCQDFAQFEIACLRSLGLPARYVSGYLETDPPPGKPRLIGADASHAWISVFCPGVGWVDFDPTNNVIPTTRHITVAWGRDYSDACPIRGVILGGGRSQLTVAVDVLRTDIPTAETTA